MKLKTIVALTGIFYWAVHTSGETVSVPAVLENVAITFTETGWNNRTWEKRSFLLRPDGVVEGLWAESGSFVLTTGYETTPCGTYVYRRLAEAGRAELVLALEGSETPTVKQLRFHSDTRASVLKEDLFAFPESMRVSPLADNRQMMNTSNRAEVAAGGSAHTGFVLGEAGHYLIRVVGPSLGAFGVRNVVSEAGLKLHRVGRPEDEIVFEAGFSAPLEVIQRAALWVGAFPLIEEGRDEAVLVRLYPGAYVAQALNLSERRGQLMVELYALPF